MGRISFSVFLATIALAQAYQWPSPRYDALETLLFEGRRSDGSNLASTQHPCKNRGSTRASIGAEWLRLAFHDSATHDASKGTGGLDASIAFELDRAENGGEGMARSLDDFSTFSSKYISRADVIAVGTTFAVASCGGPILHFRGGRVDALSADTPGVPEPDQDLATHTAMFQQQGFSAEEMIGLIACGHTIGGVRSSDHPEIVAPGADANVTNFELFDSTPRLFDSAVVTEYLEGRSVNALVTTANVTLRSDLRIFESDGNATMRKLADPEVFNSTCGSLLERMLDLVPTGVNLEEISLLTVKVSDAQLTIERGQLVFKVALRLLQPIGTSVNSKRVVTLLWCDRYGSAKDCDGHAKSSVPASRASDQPDVSPVTMRMGYYFTHYRFVIPINPDESISQFWFTVDEADGTAATTYDNNGNGYPLDQDNVLYVPEKSSVVLSGTTATSRAFHLVSAVRASLSPTQVYMSVFDSAMPKYEAPLSQDITMTLNTSIPAISGYNFYSGHLEDFGAQLTVDMHATVDGTTYTVDYMQTYAVDSRTPSSPPTAVTQVNVSPPGSRNNSAFSITRNAIRMDIGLGLLALYLGLLVL